MFIRFRKPILFLILWMFEIRQDYDNVTFLLEPSIIGRNFGIRFIFFFWKREWK